MLEFSNITGKSYESEDCVFYRNVRQSGFLLSKPDCELVDVFADGKGYVVFVFPRWLHDRHFSEWCERPH